MPTYEYGCSNGHTFEVEQRITEEPLKRCKVCKAKVQRLLSAPRFILKGGGWYSDGYSGSGSGSKGESGKTESSGSTSESKSETKSDSKSSGSDKKGGGSSTPSSSSATSAA